LYFYVIEILVLPEELPLQELHFLIVVLLGLFDLVFQFGFDILGDTGDCVHLPLLDRQGSFKLLYSLVSLRYLLVQGLEIG
jgi:hypothetical protein